MDILKHSSKRFHFNVNCCAEQDDRYAVKLTGRGHGASTLAMRSRGSTKWTRIAEGGFELATFLFDPARSQVLYPAIGKIMAFDLGTRHYRSVLTSRNPIFPLLLDQTQDGRVAYIEQGHSFGEPQTIDLLVRQPRVFASPSLSRTGMN